MKNQNKVDIFHTSIWKGLFSLAWPIILMNLLETVYNLTDTYFLGKLGALELTIPTVVWSLMFIFISLAAEFSHAGTSMVAQYTGMEDIRLAEKSAA